MKKIMFVDDEPRVLQGLRRMLHSLRGEWHMVFVESGQQALQILENDQFDVVVSDMRMPGMDGAQLLGEVMKRHPSIIRIILSGQSDEDSILRCVGKAHQFLSKPCDAESLITTIVRTCAMRDLLTSQSLKALVSRIHKLPSLPSLYLELVSEMKSPEPSISKVAEIISKDVAMTAKILQLVNSSFFGFYQHVSSPERAVAVLGIKTVGTLVLSAQAFGQFDRTSAQVLQIESLMNHSFRVGAFARAIAQAENQKPDAVDNSLTAGLLHDVGKLVLAANIPDHYAQVLAMASASGKPLWMVETDAFKTTHSEVGAYLLGLWGLPASVVETVAFHHRPSRYLYKGFSVLTAVHVAQALDYDLYPAKATEVSPGVDMHYLESLRLNSRLAAWKQICSDIELHKIAA